MPVSQATTGFGAIVVVTGFLGTFFGGWLGDYCLRYTRQAYLWVSGIATVGDVRSTWIQRRKKTTLQSFEERVLWNQVPSPFSPASR